MIIKTYTCFRHLSTSPVKLKPPICSVEFALITSLSGGKAVFYVKSNTCVSFGQFRYVFTKA